MEVGATMEHELRKVGTSPSARHRWSRVSPPPAWPAFASGKRHWRPPPLEAGPLLRGFRLPPYFRADPPTKRGSAGRADRHRRGCWRGAEFLPPWRDPWKERKKARGWTGPTARPARCAARSHNIAALPHRDRAGQAPRPVRTEFASRDLRACGRGRELQKLAGN